ncbi:Acetokinase family-domain-containing protein [Massariosphaeria phaeospora]|uniref:Probable acetate kinase n=1 Tax=Massariosphaeria phaeospora TaxID=100035 RepID=A0A7C8HY93_9PLEO|nr:Acetokinase family-domain-containing protein [Massariosphaeria phaeospora]
MSSIILSINAGSSSVKISVYKTPTQKNTATSTSPSNPDSPSTPSATPIPLAEATIDNLTAPPARLHYTRFPHHRILAQQLPDVSSQEAAFTYILEHLTHDEGLAELNEKADVQFTCHRVVHGGDYARNQVIDKETYENIEALSDLAPLHNAGALSIVKATTTLLPSAKNIAYFDSSFHSTIPPHIHTYPIDPSVARKNKLRKYGFHGISYAFIVDAVATALHKPQDQLNIIALHLGSGASACCIQNGRSLDTSMGLTPLAGLPGATRSGSIDPSLMFHFTHSAGKPSRSSSSTLHITQAEEILNKTSGWKALTGTTDFGKISSSGAEADELAFAIFADRLQNYVAPYFTKLKGEVDALVFAGGIGERGERLRAAVVGDVKCLGFALDAQKNASPGDEVVVDISAEDAKYKTLICKTDEQLQMARGVLEDQRRFAGDAFGI